MPNCTNCGNPLSASDTRCTHCGATVATNLSTQGNRKSGYTSTQQQVAYPKSAMRRRSLSAPMLAAFSAVAGVESLLYAANQNFNPKISELSKLSSMIGFASTYVPYIVGVIGVFALVATFGYFRRTSWAWKFGIVSALLSALTIVAPNLISFVLGIVCLAMLLVPSVRSSLRQ